MECPTCGAVMTPGEMSLEPSLADLILPGGGIPQLRFREPGHKPVRVLEMPASQPAMACDGCGHFLIITDPEFTNTDCVVCKTHMPAGVSACPNCGWTYKLPEFIEQH